MDADMAGGVQGLADMMESKLAKVKPPQVSQVG
jgi:hypothetical protein